MILLIVVILDAIQGTPANSPAISEASGIFCLLEETKNPRVLESSDSGHRGFSEVLFYMWRGDAKTNIWVDTLQFLRSNDLD